MVGASAECGGKKGGEGGRADFLVGEGGGGSAVTAMRGGNSCARRCSAGGGRGGAQARAWFFVTELFSTCPCEWNCHQSGTAMGVKTRERRRVMRRTSTVDGHRATPRGLLNTRVSSIRFHITDSIHATMPRHMRAWREYGNTHTRYQQWPQDGTGSRTCHTGRTHAPRLRACYYYTRSLGLATLAPCAAATMRLCRAVSFAT